MPEPYYCSADDLRTSLGVGEDVLDDTAALRLIEDAEDIVDELLGGYPTDETTGRKIVEADVLDWQWAKLGRATTKLAALLYTKPDLITSGRWNSVSGPDFSFSGPIGGAISRDVMLPLNQSELRRLGGRARPNGAQGKFDSFFNAR